MKKVKYLIFGLIACFCGIISVKAASFSVSTNAYTVVVGNTFRVTVTVNGTGTSEGSAGAWTYCVNYDSSILTLTSPASPCVNDGVVGLTSATQTYTFKAKQSGSSTISLRDAVAYDYITEGQMSTSKGSVTVTAKTQSEIIASYSTNDNLSALGVDGYEITPTFDKDTLEYSLEVPNDIEKVNISATRADNTATVKGIGEVELVEGKNKFEIVVTAQKGNQKTYIINIDRKELNPISVNVGTDNYTIVRKADQLTAPPYYVSATAIINDEEVPAFKSDISGYTLVGIKDETGNIKLAIFDNNNGSFKDYKQIGMDGIVIVVEEVKDLVEGYNNIKTIEVNGVKVDSYYKDDGEEDFVLIYGLNAATGEKNWYQYDLVEGTFQRFHNKEVIKLQQDLKDYMLLMVVFASGFGLSLLSIIALIISGSRAKKKNIKLMEILENGTIVEKEYVAEEVPKEEQEEMIEIAEPEIVQEVIKKKRGRKKKVVEPKNDEE